MARGIDALVADMRANPAGVSFADARKVATHFFGTPRTAGSHWIFKMPWPGDPRINLQADGAKAKRYQVVQLLEAIDKLKAGEAR